MDDLVGGAVALRRLRRPPDPHRRPRRAHQRTGQRPAARHRQGPRPRRRGPALLERRHRAGAGQLPRLLPDLATGRGHRLRRVLADARVARTPSTRPSSTTTAAACPSSPGPARPSIGAPPARRPCRRPPCRRAGAGSTAAGQTRRVPLGTVIGARSGDKGGNANVGLWARSAAGFAWLAAELTVERFRQLLPEAADLDVDRYELGNLWALNFVVHGLLGRGRGLVDPTRPPGQEPGRVPALAPGGRAGGAASDRPPADRDRGRHSRSTRHEVTHGLP